MQFLSSAGFPLFFLAVVSYVGFKLPVQATRAVSICPHRYTPAKRTDLTYLPRPRPRSALPRVLFRFLVLVCKFKMPIPCLSVYHVSHSPRGHAGSHGELGWTWTGLSPQAEKGKRIIIIINRLALPVCAPNSPPCSEFGIRSRVVIFGISSEPKA